MALSDAKKKAEAICNSLDVSLIGMDKVWKYRDNFEFEEDPMDFEQSLSQDEPHCRRRAATYEATEFSELESPHMDQEEKVTVVWQTE